MTPNLIDAVSSRVSPDMIGAISRDVGSSPTETSTAVRRSIPSIFASMISGASTESGASRLLSSATEASGSGLLNKLGSFGANEAREFGMRGQSMVGSVFGGREGDIANAISQSGGGRPEIVSRVLAILTPLVLAVVGKEAVSRHLNASGFADMLGSQRQAVLESPDLPQGLANRFGLRADTSASDVSVTHTPDTRRAAVGGKKNMAWGWIAALVGLLILIGLFASNRSRRHEVGRNAPPAAQEPYARAPEPAPAPAIPAPMEPAQPTSETTTTGATLSAPDWSAYKFTFEFGSTQFAADSQASVDKLADTMKAAPDTRIQLVGHTDAVGTDDANQQLGKNRAETVKQKLVDKGIDGNRIEVATEGKADPVGDNDTDQGRAENRRVEVKPLAP